MGLSSLRFYRTISSLTVLPIFSSNPRVHVSSAQSRPLIQFRHFGSLYGEKDGIRNSGSLSWIFLEAQSLRLSRWRNMAFLATAEVCDTNTSLLGSGDLRVLPPIFQMYGQRRAFSGPVTTIKVFEDNV